MNLTSKIISVFLAWSTFALTLPVQIRAQEPKPHKINVAVLDMEGRGISALEAATLTDRLRSEMVSVGTFLVVERGQMEMILEEQGFQQTGCTSAECAVEVGKLLGVEKMVAGSIGKIGSLFTLDVRMFNVMTGEIERVSKREHSGSVEGLLKLLSLVSKDLAGITDEEEKAEAEAVAKVEAEKTAKKGGKKWLLWTTVLAAAGGGAYYYLSLQGEEEIPDLALPPNPPANP